MERSTLPYGSQLVVRRDAAVATVAIELWFRAPSTGFETPTPGLAKYAATAIAASKLGTSPALDKVIKNVGGRFAISAYPDAVAIAASVPSGSEGTVIKALTTAYFTPVITQQGMRSGLLDVVIASTQARFDVEQTLRDSVFGLLFKSGPAHYATGPQTAGSLGQVSLATLQSFAGKAFRSSNSVLTVAGNTRANIPSLMAGGRADGTPELAPVDSTPASAPETATRVFSEDGVGLGWLGPAIADNKAATAMDFISDYLFRADTGLVARAADAAAPDVYLSGQFVTLHNPGVMLVEIAGKQTPLVRARVLAAIEKMRTPLAAAEFAAARSAFEYHILSDSQTPLNQADNFGWYTIEGDAAYAPSDEGRKYLQTASSLDAAYVAQTVVHYLNAPAVVELKGSNK
ncbi:MAG: hypothetical protein M3126_01885 [Candidatus Eremiobacteraeota bacterium]|nr:hypothetical protein [Candidatus Eremiobacteraeota bacterium]